MKRIPHILTATLSLAAMTAAGAAPAQQVPGPPVATPAQPAAAPAQQAPANAAANVSLVDGYVLGTGDIIEVSVLGREDFKPRVQVQTDGSIALPLIGSIPAADRTVLQLRDQIRDALVRGGYYSAPVLNISIVTYASRYVTVLGQVANPGVVPIDRAYRLSEIIARAGGVRETGSDRITLTPAGGAPRDLSLRAIATGRGEEDPVVNPGDKVFVAEAETFYIYGQVAAPGTYPIDPDLTLRKALARGGGLTPIGSERRTRLIRGERDVKGAKMDIKIEPGDVIVVGQKFF